MLGGEKLGDVYHGLVKHNLCPPKFHLYFSISGLDIMECGVNNPCHVNATCTEEVGSFSCVCKPGFSGSGIDCESN